MHCTPSSFVPLTTMNGNTHDPVTDKYYSRKATLVEKAGKIVRLEIAIDITSEEVENKIIRQMNDIIQLSNTAIMGALSIENPDESLK